MDEAPDSDPLKVLLAWHHEALALGAREPDAMTLATATRDGRPSARVVLFKGLADGQLQFVTNFGSRKGLEIAENPQVALTFFWPELTRQVRIEGVAKRASDADSDAYFRSRPRESQIGAWASSQSQPIASRAELERRFAEVEGRFRDRKVERPPGWGIFRVAPREVELWIAGPHRLHDRFRYTSENGGWLVVRLCP